MDNVSRVSGLNEVDSLLWAYYCNLAGAVATAWRCGQPPPNSYGVELRRLSELFGIAGPKSRVGAPGAVRKEPNPFDRFKTDYKPPPRK
jgi:hypothetical protein